MLSVVGIRLVAHSLLLGMTTDTQSEHSTTGVIDCPPSILGGPGATWGPPSRGSAQGVLGMLSGVLQYTAISPRSQMLWMHNGLKPQIQKRLAECCLVMRVRIKSPRLSCGAFGSVWTQIAAARYLSRIRVWTRQSGLQVYEGEGEELGPRKQQTY